MADDETSRESDLHLKITGDRDRLLAEAARLAVRRTALLEEGKHDREERAAAALAVGRDEPGADDRLRLLSGREAARTLEAQALNDALGKTRSHAECAEALITALEQLRAAKQQRARYDALDVHNAVAVINRLGPELARALCALHDSSPAFDDEPLREILGSVGLLGVLRSAGVDIADAPGLRGVDRATGHWTVTYRGAQHWVGRFLGAETSDALDKACAEVAEAKRALAAHDPSWATVQPQQSAA